MPAIRPEDISNAIRLPNEVTGPMRGLVAEYGAIDSGLAAIVDKLSPDEDGICALGSKDNLFTWTDELPQLSGFSIGRIMPLEQFEAVKVAVAREPPNGMHFTSPPPASARRLAHA
jgi:hypothetical protein